MSIFPVRLPEGDAVLYEEDARLLEDGSWLNDAVIAFALELLSLRTHKSDASLLFVAPSTAFLLAHADHEDIQELSEAVKPSVRPETPVALFARCGDRGAPLRRGTRPAAARAIRSPPDPVRGPRSGWGVSGISVSPASRGASHAP